MGQSLFAFFWWGLPTSPAGWRAEVVDALPFAAAATFFVVAVYLGVLSDGHRDRIKSLEDKLKEKTNP